MNLVVVNGNLTRDPELQYTKGGTAVVNFAIAHNEKYKKDNEWVEKTEFIELQAWGKTAENINEYFSKGSPILIRGSLKTQKWEDKDGGKRSRTLVNVDTFDFMQKSDKKSNGSVNKSEKAPAEPAHETVPPAEDDIPF